MSGKLWEVTHKLATKLHLFFCSSPDNTQSSGGVVVNFTIFINNTAFDATPTVLGTAFNSGLKHQTVGSVKKRVLGGDYVLATSLDGTKFSPSLDNIVGK